MAPDHAAEGDMIDVRVAPSPSTLMRCARVARPGSFRLARRDCELYSVQIVGGGTWTRIRCLSGTGRTIWEQPSSFTGSFWLSAACEDGLVVEVHARDEVSCPNLTINWRERDRQVV